MEGNEGHVSYWLILREGRGMLSKGRNGAYEDNARVVELGGWSRYVSQCENEDLLCCNEEINVVT